ncbi:MAG TPA: transglycosylase SLT domain-containing protein [Gemmatimonadales bacterium]|jgi:soluble lytic murein transglycosylase
MRRLLAGWFVVIAAARGAAQTPYASADSALAAGQPWRANQILAPLLAVPATRTPDVVLLAARSAAAWEGWQTVRSLLEHETWLDAQFDRLGRRLLTDADLAQARNADALDDALAAAVVDGSRDNEEQAHRLVDLARAYDRLDQLDSAATTYRRAMALLPDLADWLALRAAGVTADSAGRAALYASVALPAALPRIPWTEALAHDRDDDFDGAAARYNALGAHVAGFKVEWRGATTDSAKAAIGAGLAQLLRASSNSAESRDALDLIDQVNPPMVRDDRLAVARRAAAVNRPQDAVDQFSRAAVELPLADKDRVMLGTALGAVSRWPDAAEVFAAVHDPAYAGEAAYFRARALLRANQLDPAEHALHQVVRQYPGDTSAASIALYLLADLAIDAGEVDSARADYLRLATRYPSSSQRSHAILTAALIALERGDAGVAIRELSHALDVHAVPQETDASRYWLGRARWQIGDTAGARQAWRELLPRGPESYYAVRAAARLDTIPWPVITTPPAIPPDSLNGVFARAARLDALGLDMEARFERDRLSGDARGTDAERTGEAFLAHGFMARAAQLGSRAASAGAPKDATLWQLIYPLPFAESLRQTAASESVDPLLVASVIRQESGFEPHATSRTDARGLMQVQPSTGRDLARALGFPDFDPALLWIAPINLVFGIHHFAAALRRYPEVERSLAAYNAGESRVNSWTIAPLTGQRRSADHVHDPIDDPELFVERIPFVETRDYVRAIIRNQSVYRMVYGAPSTPH